MMPPESMRLSEFRQGKLYGREAHVKELREAFSRAKEPDQKAQIILIAGASGTGKSSLMKNAFDMPENCLLLGSGKFTEQSHAKPYEALSNSLGEVCQGISKRDNVSDYQSSLTKKLDQEQLSVLAGIIPNLSEIVSIENEGLQDSSDHGRSKESLEKLKYAFRGFLEAISQADCPIVLCLDDLHWIDPSTLDILKGVLSNSELKHLVFVGSYRDNEVDSQHILMQWVDYMETEPQKVHVDNLSTFEISALLSDVLKREDTQDLADLLHKRTNGNVLHVLQLLDHLQVEKLLDYSLSKFCWTWNLDEIRNQTSVNDTVAQMVQARIERLGKKEQACLSLCSCLGFRIEEHLLVLVKNVVSDLPLTDLHASLDILIKEGFLERLNDKRLKFVHDKVHQAAINLIEEPKLKKFCLDIGMTLLKAYRLDQSTTLGGTDDRALFLCTEELNRSRDLIKDPSFRIQLAKLNLAVAKRAATFSAFLPSADYLAVGIDLLDPSTRWIDHYSLTLELFASMAEMSFCAGNWDKQNESINEVLIHAESIDDSFRAFLVQAQWQMADGKTALSIETSLHILDELGERIPPKPSRFYKYRVFSRLKRRLNSMTDEEILALPPIKNKRKVKAVLVLCEMIFAIYETLEGNPNLSPVVMCCMVQTCLDFGFSTHSAVAFSCIAIHFANEGDCDTAHRFVQLSEVLLQRQECRATQSRVLFFQYLAAHWWKPLPLLTDGCIEAYHVGMQSGDVFFAFIGVCGYVSAYFFSGLPLGPLLTDMDKFVSQMFDYRQKLTLLLILPLYQSLMNLTEGSDDLTQLSGGKARYYRCKLDWDGGSGLQTEKSLKMQIAFYCGNLALATKMYRELKNVDVGISKGIYFVQARFFFFALIAIWQFRETGKRGWKRAAMKYYKTLRMWVVERKSINSAHKLLILDAEMMSLDERIGSRKSKNAYDTAIGASTRAGFLQDAALGAHLASRSIQDESTNYFSKALDFYLSWGAKGVADYLLANHDRSSSHNGRLSVRTDLDRTTSGYRSRARFDKKVSLEHKTLMIREGSERRQSIREM